MHIEIQVIINKEKYKIINGGSMDERFCPNCGESCEKEYETIIIQGQEFCVCCNYVIETFNNENLRTEFQDEKGEKNNAFIDFFNESGLLNSQKL